METIARGGASDVVVRVRRRDGATRRMWFRSMPVAAPDGGNRGIGMVTDVTDLLGADTRPVPARRARRARRRRRATARRRPR